MKSIKKKKLLFCAVDIGGRIEHYSDFIHENYDNVQIESFVKVKLPKKQVEADYTYNFNYHKRNKISQWTISLFFFVYSLFKYDIIYIISGENILTRKLLNFELWCYKKTNKKLITHFVGADVRNPNVLRWTNESLIKTQKENIPSPQTEFQKKLCRISEKYADYIIVTSPDMITFFNTPVIYIPVFIHLEKFNSYRFSNSTSKNNIETILHAPSNPSIKGTAFIEQTLDKLQKSKLNFETIITTHKKHAENIHPPYTVSKKKVIQLMEQSTVLIDQIIIGWYGLQTVEGLLTGNKTIVWIPEHLSKYIPDDCPIFHYSNQKNLDSIISKVLEQKNEINQSEIDGWVQKNHSIESNTEINNIFKELLQN